ncbi:hypothetical protein CLOM_g2997 [Closterium sp. NIES-68]|nr:hypothetical protein CLOM_g2997 [Closterium sp. NIES-68]
MGSPSLKVRQVLGFQSPRDPPPASVRHRQSPATARHHLSHDPAPDVTTCHHPPPVIAHRLLIQWVLLQGNQGTASLQ